VSAAVFTRESNVDLNTLYRALTDEFRVAIAQGIVLGEEPGVLGYRPSAFRDPLSITPAQYVDYFNEQQEKSRVVLLPVPVRSFTSAVSAEPTTAQVEDLYNRYGR